MADNNVRKQLEEIRDTLLKQVDAYTDENMPPEDKFNVLMASMGGSPESDLEKLKHALDESGKIEDPRLKSRAVLDLLDEIEIQLSEIDVEEEDTEQVQKAIDESNKDKEELNKALDEETNDLADETDSDSADEHGKIAEGDAKPIEEHQG